MAKSKVGRQRQRGQMPAGSDGREWFRPILWVAKRLALPLLVFCWPMLYLFRRIFIVNGDYITISNDFILLYY
ncbi:MAG: hypothetical protein WBL85_02785, partial [Sedimentisphaerales bacterium]